MTPPAFRRVGPDIYEVNLESDERRLIFTLTDDLVRMLQRPQDQKRSPHGDPTVAILFPTTHPDDPQEELEHRELMGDQAMRQRMNFLTTTARTCHQSQLDEETMDAWIRAMNAVRMILSRRGRPSPRESTPYDNFEPTYLERLAGVTKPYDGREMEEPDPETAAREELIGKVGPDGHHYLYHWLSELLSDAVDAAAEPPTGEEAGSWS